jgi:hypothetical protein
MMVAGRGDLCGAWVVAGIAASVVASIVASLGAGRLARPSMAHSTLWRAHCGPGLAGVTNEVLVFTLP